jgi:hypothetical protein
MTNLRLTTVCSGPGLRKVMACLQLMAASSGPGSRTAAACLRSTAACSGLRWCILGNFMVTKGGIVTPLVFTITTNV